MVAPTLETSRLCFSPQPSRWESIAQAMLGLAAFTALVISISATFEFCIHLEGAGKRLALSPPSVRRVPLQKDADTIARGIDSEAPLLRSGQNSQTNQAVVEPSPARGAKAPVPG